MDGQRGIQSLERGVRIFQEMHRLGRPTTLNELAKLSSMPPSKAHRYCVSLIRTGLLRRDGRGLYGLGPFGFQLIDAEATLDHARALALEALPRLARVLGETLFLSAWGESGPRILRVADVDKPISIRPSMRYDLPLHNSATGRVFAAYLAPERLEVLIAAELETFRRESKLSGNEIASRRRALSRQLADVRRRGLARTTGERYPGLNSFAAPIFDHRGRVILALTSFGLAQAFPSSWDGAVPRALRAGADDLTYQLGGMRPINGQTAEKSKTSHVGFGSNSQNPKRA
jgi:DNA-binding IclR family transcriptional regulator